MSDKEHVLIGKLKQQLADKVMDRREFVRYAALLGMSVPAAYMWAGKIAGETFVPAARAAEMPMGGVIKIAQRVPKLENPHTFSWVYDSNVVRQVCGYLTRTGTDNVTRPHLAAKWEASEDLRTWTFTMADETWQKAPGGAFTAEHAAWNNRHALDPKVGSSVIGLMKAICSGRRHRHQGRRATRNDHRTGPAPLVDAGTLVLNRRSPGRSSRHLFHYPS
jgi:peptide/nickel transport system substrate-binding protein